MRCHCRTIAHGVRMLAPAVHQGHGENGPNRRLINTSFVLSEVKPGF
jgi:hypothetical protein